MSPEDHSAVAVLELFLTAATTVLNNNNEKSERGYKFCVSVFETLWASENGTLWGWRTSCSLHLACASVELIPVGIPVDVLAVFILERRERCYSARPIKLTQDSSLSLSNWRFYGATAATPVTRRWIPSRGLGPSHQLEVVEVRSCTNGCKTVEDSHIGDCKLCCTTWQT